METNDACPPKGAACQTSKVVPLTRAPYTHKNQDMKQNEIDFIYKFTDQCHHPLLESSALPAASVHHVCPSSSEARASSYERFSPSFPEGTDSS